MSHRVLVTDSCPIIHVGLQQILSGTEFEITEFAQSLSEAREILRSSKVDIAITEYSLPDGDCFDLFAPSSGNETPTLIFTGYDNPVYVAKAIQCGMFGQVMKNASPEVLIDALRKVIQKKQIWNRRELRKVTGALATPRLESEIDVPLTQREFEVLLGVSQGLTNKRIAEELSISYETVKEHVQHILRKLGVTDRTQAAVFAVRKGLI